MPTPIRSLRSLALLQFLMGAILCLPVAYLGGLQLGASFAFGAALMVFNIVVLGWSWWRILTQKTIAWTLGIIVIKYSVLLGTIFYLARSSWFSPVGAGLGISSFVLAALFMAVLSERNAKEQDQKEIEKIGSDSF